ncbi:hypothetical protein PENTCL1PPCAC_14088, partial [Pristionchus entomophagus]
FLVHSAHAIVCRNKMFIAFDEMKYDQFNETKPCEGDYCVSAGAANVSLYFQSCLSGAAFAQFNNYCWANDGRSFCVCDTDYCTDSTKLPKTAPGYLKCGEKEYDQHCFGCDSSLSNNTKIYESVQYSSHCSYINMMYIEDLMRPQSCVRFQKKSYATDLKCRCNTVSVYVFNICVLD